jgi:glycosyltransferase involved in cell wall biosynthesis
VIARLNLGGPAHQASLLSGRRLDPERYETLLVYGAVPPDEQSMADLASREGARTEFLPSLMQPVRPQHDLRALMRLREIAREFRPDVVHTHTAKAGYLGRSAALRMRPRPAIVHTYHGHVLEGYFSAPVSQGYRALERRLARRSDRLIGVSEATVADLVRLGIAPRERFQVVRLGLDLKPFSRLDEDAGQAFRAEVGVDAEETLVTYVGRVVPIKRLDVMLRGVGEARRQGAPVRLAVIGDGETRSGLETLASELGIAEAVAFLGYRSDLAHIAAGSDIAALSSANEGTPVSLIEAGAAGRPAVASEVGGVPEVVTSETGILFPAGDDRALGVALARLSAHPDLRRRMGRRAQERVTKRYSIERLLGDIDALYAELLSGRGALRGR